MPLFRPLPVLTVFTLIALAILISLGNWQMQRMTWKADLIATYETRGTVDSFREALCGETGEAFGPSVHAAPPLAGAQLRFYSLRQTPGWIHLGLMPAPRCNPGDPARYLFVEIAFESLDGSLRTSPEVWRIDPLPTARPLGSRNDPAADQWYVFDVVEMAGHLGIDPQAVLRVWARADDGIPQSLTATPPAKHLGYALTWFGLAIALIGIYLALHINRGRLRWK